MIRAICVVALAALPLAACDGAKDGTSITINSSGADGDVLAGVDGNTGQVSLNVPGFKANMTLPKIKLNADDFEMNGVHLFPGSHITNMNIDARDGGTGGEDKGVVKVSFDSPATPETVRGWLLEKLNNTGNFKLQANGTGLTGTTDEGKPFRLELTPDGASKSKGVIQMGS